MNKQLTLGSLFDGSGGFPLGGMVRWDNGSGLNVIYGEDTCRILDSVTVICYGGTDIWDSRDDAKAFYLEAMAACDGCERARYTSVYLDLMAGLEVCTDDE